MVTSYDQKGFLTTATIADGLSTGWNDQGLPTTVYPLGCVTTKPATRELVAADALAMDEVATTDSSDILLATAASSSLITAQVTRTSDARALVPWLAAICTLFIASAMGMILV